jgi:hypothetical protein
VFRFEQLKLARIISNWRGSSQTGADHLKLARIISNWRGSSQTGADHLMTALSVGRFHQ